jgi:hypothetical protein
LFELLLVATLMGVWLARKNLRVLAMLGLFLSGSLAIVFYVNFADGSRPDSAGAFEWLAQMDKLQDHFAGDPGLPASIPNLNDFWAAYKSKNDHAPAVESMFSWQDFLDKKGLNLPSPPYPVHREVRERDYFFTPAFLFYNLLLCLALASFLSRTQKTGIHKAAMVALCLAWLLPFGAHFKSHDRSGDEVARDFAYNSLVGIPQNGVLVTYGDNDTFPLWYIQMVEEFRTDVAVINHSLAYMDWYRNDILRQYPNLRHSTKIPNSGGRFIEDLQAQNPDVQFSFMLGGSQNSLAGLFATAGMDSVQADSALAVNLGEKFRYTNLENGSWKYRESDLQTIQTYRYLARYALQKQVPFTPEQEKRVRELLNFIL